MMLCLTRLVVKTMYLFFMVIQYLQVLYRMKVMFQTPILISKFSYSIS